MRLAAIGDNCVDFYERQGWAYPGGNAVNVAVYGRQLGMDTAYLGWIGTDTFGDMMQEKLKEQGVETVRMQRKEGKTAVTYIELVDGDRKFGEDFLNVLEGFVLSDEDLRYLAGFDCVHMAVWGQCDACLGRLPSKVKTSYDFSNKDRFSGSIYRLCLLLLPGRQHIYQKPFKTRKRTGGRLRNSNTGRERQCCLRRKRIHSHWHYGRAGGGHPGGGRFLHCGIFKQSIRR